MTEPPDNAGLAIADALASIDDELSLLRRAAFPQRAVRAAGSWPWAPGTIAQGFMNSRWNRRDGDVYGGAALRGAHRAPTQPIAGGDERGKKGSGDELPR